MAHFDDNRDFAEVEIDNLREELDARDAQIAQLQAQLAQGNQVPAANNVNIDLEISRGRVPDLVKGLPIFSGNPKTLSDWIKSVERILSRYRHLNGSEELHLWLQEIRNKIIGEAGDMLASNGTPLHWDTIKRQLMIFYGDQRELSTLLHKLFSERQGGRRIGEFYSSIQDVFTGISTRVQMDPQWENPNEIVKFVNKICLEKFVDGLEEPFSSYVSLLQPQDLNQAHQFALEKANKMARRSGNYELNDRTRPSQSRPPPIPMRHQLNPKHQQIKQYYPPNMYHQQNPPQMQQPIQRYYPQNQHRPPTQQPYRQPNQQHPYRPPYNQNPNPAFQPRQNPVEPMEVDRSIRSRNINYMNRPMYHELAVPEQADNYYPDYYEDSYADNYNEDHESISHEEEKPQNEEEINFQIHPDQLLIT